MGLLMRMQLRTVVLGAIFAPAFACVSSAQLFAQELTAPPAQQSQSQSQSQSTSSSQSTAPQTTPPQPPAPPQATTPPPGQWPVLAAPVARTTTVRGTVAQGTAPQAQTPRQTPFPPATAPSATPPTTLWIPPMAGHAFAATAPRRTANASEQKSGTFTTHDGLRLRLETETGNIRIFTDAANEVRYLVRIETDASGPEAQKLVHQLYLNSSSVASGVTISGKIMGHEQRDRVWVTYELHVPRKYNVEVTTHAGNIQVGDVDGRVSLITDGGNISVGNVTGGVRQAGIPAARLESIGGGHIFVRDVNGDLKAMTAGGHITAGNISGDANLSTGGGHIHAGNIHGVAQLETGGGNISVERAGSRVTASSGGGQISFGEAAGAIQARAAGGGIRVLRVSGPMQLDSNGGSIFLTKVENAVHASTGTGSITAWFSPTLKISASSQLESGHGDIVVYVPRDLQMTIEATIDTAAGHHIAADPSLMMKTTYHTGESGKQVRGVCDINGGGEVLKLRAMEGNIQLRYLDDAVFMRTQELVAQQVRQEFVNAQKNFEIFIQQNAQDMQDMQHTWTQNSSGQMIVVRPPQPATAPNASPAVAVTTRPGMPAPAATPAMPPTAQTEVLWMRLGEYWWGGVRVEPAEQETRRVKEVKPVYPDVARQAGIEGMVSLRVVINEDGAVEKVEVLSGEQALRQAAITAVSQWRYKPLLLQGNPARVVTTVNVDFKIP
jgi:TonB family protein